MDFKFKPFTLFKTLSPNLNLGFGILETGLEWTKQIKPQQIKIHDPVRFKLGVRAWVCDATYVEGLNLKSIYCLSNMFS